MLIVDENANADQRSALIQLARDMGGALLENVRNIPRRAGGHGLREPSGATPPWRPGELVEIKTRAITHKDHLCGSEFVYYPAV